MVVLRGADGNPKALYLARQGWEWVAEHCLDVVLCSLLWVTLLGQGVGLGDPQRSLPTPTIL